MKAFLNFNHAFDFQFCDINMQLTSWCFVSIAFLLFHVLSHKNEMKKPKPSLK